MANRIFTFCIGLVFLFLGICVLVPAMVAPPPPEVAQPIPVHFHFVYLFSYLPANAVTCALFLIAGVSGLLAASSLRISRRYEKIVCIGSVVLFFLGFIPFGVSRVWGLLPLFSWTDLLFFLIAMFTFYFAFVDGPHPTLNQPI